MKWKIEKIAALTFIFLIMVSGFAIISADAIDHNDHEMSQNDFTDQFSLNHAPEEPTREDDVEILLESETDQVIEEAHVLFQYKHEHSDSFSDPGGKQMEPRSDSQGMKGVISSDYHEGGTTIRYWVNATFDQIDWITSDKRTYTISKKDGWINEVFSDNLNYTYEPKNPKANEKVDFTLNKKVDVEINSAYVVADIDQPNSEAQEGRREFTKENDHWEATLPAYPEETDVTFHISAYDKYNDELTSQDRSYVVESNVTVRPLISVYDTFKDKNVDGAKVIVRDQSEEIIFEGKTDEGQVNVEDPLVVGEYDIEVTYDGQTKTKTAKFTGDETEQEAIYEFDFQSQSTIEHDMISFPQNSVLIGLIGVLIVPTLLLGFIYIKKEEKQIELMEGNEAESEPVHPMIDRFWEWVVKETSEPDHVIPAAFFLLSILGLNFIPFYPWWMIGSLSLVIAAISYKYPYSSLLIISLFLTGAAGYQSPEFGLVILVFSLLILLASFFDWRFGFLVFLMIFLGKIGGLYLVPAMSLILFSIYLSVISTAVAGIFLVMLSSSGNYELIGFVTSSPHTTSFMRFDKPVVSNFTPSDLGEALGSIGNANSAIIENVLANNFGASILPFFQILLWSIALYVIYLMIGSKNPKLNNISQWLKYPIKKDRKKPIIGSLLLGLSPVFGLVYFDYFSGLGTIGLIKTISILIGGVVLSYVSIGLGFMTKSLFREYYRSQLGVSDVGTRIAEMADLGETPFESVGGLDDVKSEVKESILMPLLRPDISEKFGVETSKGMMLYGPPGCGKTLLMKALATELDVEMINVKCGDVMSRWYGESEESMMELFEAARERKPAIIFFDEIDAIAKKRDMYSADDVTPRLLSLLLSELDGMDRSEGIIMVGSTNKPDMVDPALLRPGRFDKIIYVPPPDKEERKEILKIHMKDKPLSNNVDIDKYARKSEGFSGADIANLAKESATRAMRKSIDTGGMRKITEKDIDEVLNKMSPSITPSMKEEYERVKAKYERKIHETKEPETERGITFNEIPDLEDEKEVLEEEILHPITEKDLVREFDIAGTKNLMLYGPKGCQKLSLLKAAGNEIGIPMRVITAMEFKEVITEGSRDVVDELLKEMKDMAPSVIVLTEVEEIANKSVTEEKEVKVFDALLNLINEINEVNNITLISTSHYPAELKPELLERGRLDKRMFIPPPNFERRKELFEIYLDPIPTEEGINYNKLTELSEGYTSDDITSSIEEAKIKALSSSKEEDNPKVTQEDLEEAIKEIESSLMEDMVESAERFKEKW